MNRTILIGNLTKDPELNTTNSGISFCKFGIAVQRRFENAQGEREADFLNVIVWRGQAEACHKFLKKGSKVAISGSIQTGSYEAQDGTRRYTFDINADEVEFLSTPQGKKEKVEEVAELKPIDDGEDLPF